MEHPDITQSPLPRFHSGGLPQLCRTKKLVRFVEQDEERKQVFPESHGKINLRHQQVHNDIDGLPSQFRLWNIENNSFPGSRHDLYHVYTFVGIHALRQVHVSHDGIQTVIDGRCYLRLSSVLCLVKLFQRRTVDSFRHLLYSFLPIFFVFQYPYHSDIRPVFILITIARMNRDVCSPVSSVESEKKDSIDDAKRFLAREE